MESLLSWGPSRPRGMPETRPTGDKQIRTNPGKFGRNRTNRANGAKPGKKWAFLGKNGAKWGKKRAKSGKKKAKMGLKKNKKNGQTKPKPGKTGRNRKFRQI